MRNTAIATGAWGFAILLALGAGANGCGDDGELDPDADGDTDVDTDTDTDTDTGTGSDTDTGTGSDTDTGSETDTDTDPDGPCLPHVADITVDDDIEADTHWTCDNTYILTGIRFITGDSDLTIDPGTQIQGDNNSALISSVGSRIIASGTPEDPIVFTSSAGLGARAVGDWGGVVLLGDGNLNLAGNVQGHLEGIEPADDPRAAYGGDDDSNDCGTLEYVRVEFAGYAISPDNELNGIAVAGCGSGTTLNHIQIHKGGDDGVEFWGGTATIDHLLVTQVADDGLDWDFGWSGSAQFVAIQQDTSGSSGDNAFEVDNNPIDHDALPRTSASIYNATLVGSDFSGGTQQGITLRRGTAGHLANLIVVGFPSRAMRVLDTATVAQWNADDLFVNNSIFFDNLALGDGDAALDEAAELAEGARDNQFADPGLPDPHNLIAPNFVPAAGSIAEDNPADPTDDDLEAADYIGAFEPGGEDWTDGWTAFPEN